MESSSGSPCLWFCLNRLHRGRSGKSFSRSNSRNRSTSRVLLCHRNTPSDQQGGSSRHQPMNVALPNGQRPTQTKAEARGEHAGQTSSTSKNQRTSFGGKHARAKGWGHLCALPALWEQTEWERPHSYHNHKKGRKKKKKKNGGNWCLHSKMVKRNFCITLVSLD